MRRWTVIGAASVLSVVLLAIGCGGHACEDPPPHVRAVIQDLTAKLGNSDEAYDAGLDLGEIGLTCLLPPATLKALRTASEDRTLSYADIDTLYVGGGRVWNEAGDGARIAFLRWQLRDMESDAARLQLLWTTSRAPHRTDAVSRFCIEELIRFGKPEVIPYLFCAAVLGGSWYESRMAALHLGDFWPTTKPLLVLLVNSDRQDVAQIARQVLQRQGKPLPPDGAAIGPRGDLIHGIPTWPE